jgi:aromatic ring-opening dioxygenase LigB subunit
VSGVFAGALVPHAPVLLPEAVGEDVAAETRSVREAAGALSFGDAEVVVMLSPHASASGVYASVAGSLDTFGIKGVELQRRTDPALIATLSERWDKPMLDGPLDHGAVVPLLLLDTGTTPIVVAGLREIGDDPRALDAALADGFSFGEAISRSSEDQATAVIVSAHTSSALTPRAPLTERAEAKQVEAAVLRSLRGDPSALRSSLTDLWRLGGSCSPGPLAAYASLFAGRASEVLAYGYPFGVGYVVARPR